MNILKFQFRETKKAQVLVIVLVTMMVLSIILVSTTVNLIKDSEITQSNNKYEALNTFAEKMAYQLGIQYANPQKNNLNISIFATPLESEEMSEQISDLLKDLGWETNNTCQIEDTCYKCNVSFDDSISDQFIDEGVNSQTTNPIDIKAIARICDSYEIRNAELFKDEILVYGLGGIDTNIIDGKTFQVSWEPNEKLRNLALELSVDFIYTSRGISNYGTVKSVFKSPTSNIFSGSLNSNNSNYIEFLNTSENSFNFSLSNFEAWLNSKEGYFKHFHNNDLDITSYKQLRFRPILNSDIPVAMDISIRTSDMPQLSRVQGRSIEVTIYEQPSDVETEAEGGFRGPQASVISTVPATKFSGLFDYVLKNETTIQL